MEDVLRRHQVDGRNQETMAERLNDDQRKNVIRKFRAPQNPGDTNKLPWAFMKSIMRNWRGPDEKYLQQ